MILRLLTTIFVTSLLATSVNAGKADTAKSTETKKNTEAEKSADAAEEIRDAKLFFDEAFDDYQQELEIAKENGKQGVLIMYEMEFCPFCARMKAKVLNQSTVQDYFHKNFRIFSVDINGDVEITDFQGKETTQKDFALKSRVRATPVFQFYNLEGEPLKNGRLTGATKNVEEFMLLGEYVVSKENEKQPFSRYKRSLKSASNKPTPTTVE